MAQSQEATTVAEFGEQNGYFPATVEAAERHNAGWVLLTIDPDPDNDIVTFFDDEPAVRRSEYDARLL